MKKSGEKTIWDSVASRYDRSFTEEYRRLVSEIVNEIRPEDSVLELACGTGLVAFDAAKKCRSVTGIDSSRAMIDAALAKKGAREAENTEFRLGNAMDLSGESARYDAVVLCNMLHVVSDPRIALVQARTVLRENGRIIIATYCHGESLSLRDTVFSAGMRFLHRIGKIPHLYRFRFEDVLSLCNASSLRLVRASLLEDGGFPCAFIVCGAAESMPV